MSNAIIQISNAELHIGKRIKRLRTEEKLTARVFSAACGVSQGYLSNIEHGKVRASQKLLIGIAIKFPKLSTRWLLTGEGPMWNSEKEPSIAGETGAQIDGIPDPTPCALNLEERQHYQVLRLLAKRGGHLMAWRIWLQLSNAYPKAVDIQTLSKALEASPSEIAADLALLEASKLIEHVSDSYRCRDEAALLNAHGVADRAQLSLEALRLLLMEITPILINEPQQARMAVATLQMSEEEAEEFQRDVWEYIKERWGEADSRSGDTDAILVLGLASRPQTLTRPSVESSE